MTRTSHFDTAMTLHTDRIPSRRNGGGRDTTKLKKMIDDMHRIISSLDAEIALEENRARVHDQTHYTYPIPAKAMRQRRDNLTLTIASLEAQLPGAEHIVAERETVSAA